MDTLIDKTATALASSAYAIALTGAGISTESGIPDFRGPDGLWTKNPEAEKRAYQTYGNFVKDPLAYWHNRLSGPSWSRPDAVEPNVGHYALAELEKLGVLKSILTQNIDNLHLKAGSVNVIEYHGNATKLRCLSCLSRYNMDDIPIDKLQAEGNLPPRCQNCGYPLKSDVVYFQEPIPQDVIGQSIVEAQKCDVMLICGTSAAVYPFASLPYTAREKPGVVIVEINAEPTLLTTEGISDYLIQGRTGDILPKLAQAVQEKLNS